MPSRRKSSVGDARVFLALFCPLTRAAGQFLAARERTSELPSQTGGRHNGTCSCECKAIVESVLVPLTRHYLATGDAARAFFYLLESAAAYLHISNTYMVSPLDTAHGALSSHLALGPTTSPLQ